jgi:hypothetical protein
MNPLELIVLRYITEHINTKRSTCVDALGYGEWGQQRRVRQTLDSFVLRGTIIASATKPVRYTIPQQVPSAKP